MEAKMRVLTIAELMRLTCIELADLLIRITNALPHLAAGSAERQIAQINLRNVRSALARERAAIPLETDPTMPNQEVRSSQELSMIQDATA